VVPMSMVTVAVPSWFPSSVRCLLDTPPPVLDTPIPVLDTHPPGLNTHPPVLDTPPPVLDTPIPVLDTHPPVLDTPVASGKRGADEHGHGGRAQLVAQLRQVPAWGSGFRVQGAGCRVESAGYRVQGSGFRVQGSGWRVEGGGWRLPAHHLKALARSLAPVLAHVDQPDLLEAVGERECVRV